MKLLLAPHADDECLFSCYVLLRHQPLVLLCFPGATRHGDRHTREAELASAMEVVGCEWQSLVDAPDLEEALTRYNPEQVWAPLPEPDGNTDHNYVGELAARLWPDRTIFYTTYSPAGRTVRSEPVEFEPEWPAIKRQALACYQSQQANPGTREHFVRPLGEYLVQREDADL